MEVMHAVRMLFSKDVQITNRSRWARGCPRRFYEGLKLYAVYLDFEALIIKVGFYETVENSRGWFNVSILSETAV